MQVLTSPPLREITRVLTSQNRSYKPSFSTSREGSAYLLRKVDCSMVKETGLVLNPIIKRRLSNYRSRPTCTKGILGCGLIPQRWFFSVFGREQNVVSFQASDWRKRLDLLPWREFMDSKDGNVKMLGTNLKIWTLTCIITNTRGIE